MNRALLKQDAKDAMKAANPHPVLTTLVFWAIQLAAQIILGLVSSICGFTTYFAAAIFKLCPQHRRFPDLPGCCDRYRPTDRYRSVWLLCIQPEGFQA